MNNSKLQSAIAAFVKTKKANAAYYDDNWTERKERKVYYQSFTKDKLLATTEEDFFEYMSRLWSMLIWGEEIKDTVVDEKELYLWGQNYVPESSIIFEYYLGALHSSFHDFIMKDAKGRIHFLKLKASISRH